MCYSAKLVEKWRAFRRDTGIGMDIGEFHRLYHLREQEGETTWRIPRGFDLEFAEPQTPEEQAIRDVALRFRKDKTARLEADTFKQRKRLADAERSLAEKDTRVASESRRIAANKVQQNLGKLALLKDDRPHGNDYRIFPFSYAPVLVHREGRIVMTAARYHLRQPGKPATIDRRFPGLYNARRDNLTRFWRQQYGATHAVMLVNSFYENVAAPDGSNRVLHFLPQPAEPMWIACLQGTWVDPSDGARILHSFAAVTDEPTPEVSAAGHDRLIVNLTPEAAIRWLTPGGRSDAELECILDDRQRPYYEHRLAA